MQGHKLSPIHLKLTFFIRNISRKRKLEDSIRMPYIPLVCPLGSSLILIEGLNFSSSWHV